MIAKPETTEEAIRATNRTLGRIRAGKHPDLKGKKAHYFLERDSLLEHEKHILAALKSEPDKRAGLVNQQRRFRGLQMLESLMPRKDKRPAGPRKYVGVRGG